MRSVHAKLTESAVVEIRKLKKEGVLTNRQIANTFGISKGYVWKVNSRSKWSWLEESSP